LKLAQKVTSLNGADTPPWASVIRLAHGIQQQRVFLCKRKDPTAARRAESELGRNSHHYFGLPI
jgi:hypothetical protein